MMTELRRALLFTAVMMAFVGGAYHGVLWGVGRIAFRAQAEGSLIRRPGGTIAGSHLIAQPFMRDEYFRPRPSAVEYNAASTGASNDGPSDPDHVKAVRGRLKAIEALEGVTAERVPPEMVTASGSGVDPHIPPDAAQLQAPRVARARGVDVARVRALVRAHTERPLWGVFGRSRVNVLDLNLALDDAFGGRK